MRQLRHKLCPEQFVFGYKMTEEFQDIIEAFEFLDDWEDRYRHLIELGKKLPTLNDALRVDATKVDGCASQVWIVPKIEGNGANGILTFDGESDAMIVRGLIAILSALYNGRTLQEVVDTDASEAFGRLGLDQHLSAQRSNGLRAMIVRIQSVAQRGIVSN